MYHEPTTGAEVIARALMIKKRFFPQCFTQIAKATRPRPEDYEPNAWADPLLEAIGRVMAEMPAVLPFDPATAVPSDVDEAWAFLVRDVSRRHGLAPAEMLSRRSGKPLVAARRELANLMVEHTKVRLKRLGELLDRDHTTVLNLLGRRHH